MQLTNVATRIDGIPEDRDRVLGAGQSSGPLRIWLFHPWLEPPRLRDPDCEFLQTNPKHVGVIPCPDTDAVKENPAGKHESAWIIVKNGLLWLPLNLESGARNFKPRNGMIRSR
jgi:hypothetical protein